jgi:4-amino-4-deoxy-L-arabinose transferase-like glycosyltransferase
MSASFMNHASALFFILLALYTLKKSLDKQSLLYALASGFALGAILTIRTGEGIALSIPLGIYFLMCCLRQKKTHLFICFAFSFLGMLAILLTYNYITNGDPLLFGYQVRWGKEHTIGFSEVGVINELAHTPFKGMLNTLRNMIALNQNLFEWPVPSLLPLYLLATPFLFKKNAHDYLFLCCLLAAPVMYFFYFYQDLCLGPRFYYISLPFIFIVTAKSILNSIGDLSKAKVCDPHRVKNAFLILFCFYLLFAGIIRVPNLYRYYSDSFWLVDNHIMKKAREMKLENVLIFLKGTNKNGDDLGSGFLYNSPGLNDPIVFARDLGQRNQELLPFFPGREYYVASRDPKGNVLIDKLHLAHPDEPSMK